MEGEVGKGRYGWGGDVRLGRGGKVWEVEVRWWKWRLVEVVYL